KSSRVVFPNPTGNATTPLRDVRPPPRSHTNPIAGRVRRKRQRLHSNDSIESDPANQWPSATRTPSRRVTPDRVLTFVATHPERRFRIARPPVVTRFKPFIAELALTKTASAGLSHEFAHSHKLSGAVLSE